MKQLIIQLFALFASASLAFAADGYDEAKAKKGFKLFTSKGCAACHGPKGMAGSPAAKAMKARNFAKEPFKQGGTVKDVINTILKGVPGTGMVPQAAAVPDKADQEALAHFVVSVSKGASYDDTESSEASVDKGPPTFKRPAIADNQISISYAMKLMAKKPRLAFDNKFMDGSKGAKLYQAHCASCHGNNGEGGIALKMISAAPYVRVKTEALLGHDGYWLATEKKFSDLITKGLPGDLMPGNGTLSKTDVKALYNFFVESRKKAK